MTNHQFTSSDSSGYCDNNNDMNSSLIINADQAVVILPASRDQQNQQNLTRSTSNSLSTNICQTSNPEKPPYCSTVEDVESHRPSSNSKTSFLHVLHLIAVVVASSTINGVVFGVVNNFGVFYVSLIELFKQDTSLLSLSGTDETLASTDGSVDGSNSTVADSALLQPLIAGVGSLNIGLIFFCSIFASVLSDRYGIRQVCFVGGILSTIGMYASSVSVNLIYLYITYGLVLGIGASLVYAPSLAILGHYFDRRLGLVNGLVTAGSSGFSIVMPIVLRSLINMHGIQTTFKYLTILMAALILCALTFKETIPKAKSKSVEANKRSHGSRSSLASLFQFEELWKNRLYLCWLISIPTGLFGYFVPFCHLVKHAQDINSTYSGEAQIMCIGIFSLFGRLLSGPLADFSHVNRIALQQIAFISIGTLTMSLTVVRDFSLLLVCCGLGLFDGFFISLLGPIAFDLVGPEYANQAIGLLLCFCSLPLTTGPPIAAYAYGVYGNYTLAFFLAGIPPIVAAVLMFNIIRLQRIRSRSFSALSPVDNMAIRNGFVVCSENGEKLHLLSSGSASTPSASKMGMSEPNSSVSVTDDSSEHTSLIKQPNSNPDTVPSNSQGPASLKAAA